MNSLEELDKKISEHKKKIYKSPGTNPKTVSPGVFVITELLANIGVGAFIGYQLDKFFNTKALFLFLFIILGLISAIYTLYKKLK